MSKKQQKKPRGWLVAPAQINGWLADAAVQLAEGDYERVITICRRVLSYVPAKAVQRVDALRYLGNAHAMLKHFEDAYQVLSEAVELAPSESDLWYNRGMSARFTSRTAQSLLDLERALALEGSSELTAKFKEELTFARRVVDRELAQRGRGFTLERLLEQQEAFQHALSELAAGHWVEAEEGLRRVIGLADVLPQPWGNLGLALIMQRRFDEAEAALRQALKMDPNYSVARSNLADLAQIRETGQLPQVVVTSPFERVKLRQTIQFTKR